MATITFRGSRADLRRILATIPQVLSGRVPDTYGIAQAVQLRAGVALLSQVQQDFLIKSRGGVGRDGIQWRPLQARTIARRRQGPKRSRRKGKPSAVDILRDTGELLRSLSPGVDDRPSGADGQVFATAPGRVIVGTNKKPWHQRGNRNLPARPMWPNNGRIPAAWWQAINLAAMRGVVRAVVLLTQRRTS